MDNESNKSTKSVTSVRSVPGSSMSSLNETEKIDAWIREKASKAYHDLPSRSQPITNQSPIMNRSPNTERQVIDNWIREKTERSIKALRINKGHSYVEDNRSVISASPDSMDTLSTHSSDSSRYSPSQRSPFINPYDSSTDPEHEETRRSYIPRLATKRLKTPDRQETDKYILERARFENQSFTNQEREVNESWICKKAKKAYDDLPRNRNQTACVLASTVPRSSKNVNDNTRQHSFQQQNTQTMPRYQSQYNDISRDRENEADEARYYEFNNSPAYQQQNTPRPNVLRRMGSWISSWRPRTTRAKTPVLQRDTTAIHRIHEENDRIRTQRNEEADQYEAPIDDPRSPDQDYYNDYH